jgi:DNA repair exonuclease SbcCD ATPase subunit
MEMIEKDAILSQRSEKNLSESGKESATSAARPSSYARELNPALFGESASKAKVFEGSQASTLPHLMQTDQKIQDLRTQLETMADHLGKWTSQYSEFVKSCQIKFDRVQQVMIKLENNDQYIVNESAQKFARVNDRFAERKSIDAKIQEMIDRHNSVLKSFEMRLTQMQKLMNEKEAQLLTAQGALNEAKMEISRLKRL